MKPRLGFLIALRGVLRVMPGGLLFSGLPCSSWVWISRGSTGRSQDNPRGTVENNCTKVGNTLAARTALLFLVATVRCVYCATEQPGSSVVIKYDPMEFVMNLRSLFAGFPGSSLCRLRCALFSKPQQNHRQTHLLQKLNSACQHIKTSILKAI